MTWRGDTSGTHGFRLAGTAVPCVGAARVYACGITPYDVTHLGHAATFVWVDVAVRVLRAFGVDVQLCRNVTDVDDVLLAAADRAGQPYDAFAAIQQYQFDKDMAALGVRQPTIEPRARTYVDDVLAVAAGLVDRGLGYVRSGSVYWRGSAMADRAGLDRDDAVRLAEEFDDHPGDEDKDDPLDVAVWRAAERDEPAWESPWGRGRPGWHATCTAMALRTFGPSVDVLAGGRDLRFPHHAYQAAFAEGLTGVVPFARAQMHVGVVRVDGVKMAKSTGNLVLVGDLLERWPLDVVRLALLDRDWSADWDFAEDAVLGAATSRAERLRSAAGRGGDDPAVTGEIERLLLDDLDVRRALDVAIEDGGQPARRLGSIIGLY